MEKETTESANNSMYYVLGGLALVAVLVGAYVYMPKTTPTTSPEVTGAAMTPAATPTPGPITKLACDTQYYNPVIGFEKYYLSVEGGDTEGASEVTCTTTVTQENKVVAKEKISVPLTAKPERGGLEFKCSTPALELKSTIPTKVEVTVVDDNGEKATCSALFALPKP